MTSDIAMIVDGECCASVAWIRARIEVGHHAVLPDESARVIVAVNTDVCPADDLPGVVDAIVCWEHRLRIGAGEVHRPRIGACHVIELAKRLR